MSDINCDQNVIRIAMVVICSCVRTGMDVSILSELSWTQPRSLSVRQHSTQHQSWTGTQGQNTVSGWTLAGLSLYSKAVTCLSFCLSGWVIVFYCVRHNVQYWRDVVWHDRLLWHCHPLPCCHHGKLWRQSQGGRMLPLIASETSGCRAGWLMLCDL